MKLMVRHRSTRGAGVEFHPRLVRSANGWWSGELAADRRRTGFFLVHRGGTVEAAVSAYFRELRRMDYEVVQEAGFELKPPEVKS